MNNFQINEVDGSNHELILNGKKIFSPKDVPVAAFSGYYIGSVGFWKNNGNLLYVGGCSCCDGMVYILENVNGEWMLVNVIHTEVGVSGMFPVKSIQPYYTYDLMVMGIACGGTGIRLVSTKTHHYHDSVTAMEGFLVLHQLLDKDNYAHTNLAGMIIKSIKNGSYINLDILLTKNGVEIEKESKSSFECICFR